VAETVASSGPEKLKVKRPGWLVLASATQVDWPLKRSAGLPAAAETDDSEPIVMTNATTLAVIVLHLTSLTLDLRQASALALLGWHGDRGSPSTPFCADG
jgi:hypothetical protein